MVVRDAINALRSVLHDPEVDLAFDDRELVLDTIGALYDYDTDE